MKLAQLNANSNLGQLSICGLYTTEPNETTAGVTALAVVLARLRNTFIHIDFTTASRPSCVTFAAMLWNSQWQLHTVTMAVARLIVTSAPFYSVLFRLPWVIADMDLIVLPRTLRDGRIQNALRPPGCLFVSQ